MTKLITRVAATFNDKVVNFLKNARRCQKSPMGDVFDARILYIYPFNPTAYAKDFDSSHTELRILSQVAKNFGDKADSTEFVDLYGDKVTRRVFHNSKGIYSDAFEHYAYDFGADGDFATQAASRGINSIKDKYTRAELIVLQKRLNSKKAMGAFQKGLGKFEI